jgi:hypothetical protein
MRTSASPHIPRLQREELAALVHQLELGAYTEINDLQWVLAVPETRWRELNENVVWFKITVRYSAVVHVLDSFQAA